MSNRFKIAALVSLVLCLQTLNVQAQDPMSDTVRDNNEGGSSEFDTEETQTVPNPRPTEAITETTTSTKTDINPYGYIYDFKSFTEGSWTADIVKQSGSSAVAVTMGSIALTEPAIAHAIDSAMRTGDMFATAVGNDHRAYEQSLSPDQRATYFNCIRREFEDSGDPLQARMRCVPGPSSQSEAAAGLDDAPESRALSPEDDPVLAAADITCSDSECSFDVMAALLGNPPIPMAPPPEREFIDQYIGRINVTFTDLEDLIGSGETEYEFLPPLEAQGLYARYMFHLEDVYGALTYLIYGRCMMHNERWQEVGSNWSPWRIYQGGLSDFEAMARAISFVNEEDGTIWPNPWPTDGVVGPFPAFPQSFWSRVNSFPERNAKNLMDFLSGSFGFSDMLVENLFAIFIAEEQGEPTAVATYLDCLNLAGQRFHLEEIRDPATGQFESTAARAKVYYELAQILALDQLVREIDFAWKGLVKASEIHFIHVGENSEHPIRTLGLNLVQERIQTTMDNAFKSDSRQSELGFDPAELHKFHASFRAKLEKYLEDTGLGFRMEFKDNASQGALGSS